MEFSCRVGLDKMKGSRRMIQWSMSRCNFEINCPIQIILFSNQWRPKMNENPKMCRQVLDVHRLPSDSLSFVLSYFNETFWQPMILSSRAWTQLSIFFTWVLSCRPFSSFQLFKTSPRRLPPCPHPPLRNIQRNFPAHPLWEQRITSQHSHGFLTYVNNLWNCK